MTPIIRQSFDYEKFRLLECNRTVTDSEKYVFKSISTRDLTKYAPIVIDKNYNIIDGQHRFAACKKLRKPIYYIQIEEDIDTDEAIRLFNTSQKTWQQQDFLHFHACKIGGRYKDLEDFYNQNSFLGISNCLVIYTNPIIGAKELKSASKDFKKNTHADDIVEFLRSDELKIHPARNQHSFVLAVKKAFDIYTAPQMEKLKKMIITVPLCANYEQYLTAFGNIINKWKRR